MALESFSEDSCEILIASLLNHGDRVRAAAQIEETLQNVVE